MLLNGREFQSTKTQHTLEICGFWFICELPTQPQRHWGNSLICNQYLDI